MLQWFSRGEVLNRPGGQVIPLREPCSFPEPLGDGTLETGDLALSAILKGARVERKIPSDMVGCIAANSESIFAARDRRLLQARATRKAKRDQNDNTHSLAAGLTMRISSDRFRL
jgi:hypothetical protein